MYIYKFSGFIKPKKEFKKDKKIKSFFETIKSIISIGNECEISIKSEDKPTWDFINSKTKMLKNKKHDGMEIKRIKFDRAYLLIGNSEIRIPIATIDAYSKEEKKIKIDFDL